MTTVQIALPDTLAQDAQAAGLFSPERMEEILREQLRRRAGESLQAMWDRLPEEELTPEMEEQICQDVREVRAEMRRKKQKFRGIAAVCITGFSL